ncbi:hypothetical protein [Alkalihalobacillus sp. TS-13]|uniref:hypothetical protein n=1 Tax=Alkalihalobacillus sp. TS-13 TaxID=2842455 RepID=UPI001C86B100|nr:hypothetical protein [Alkalihalobacillus sp. TS-13]
MESKQEKFVRLAEQRVTEVIKKIRLIGNLSNRRNYDYEKDHVNEIIKTLENELKELKKRFEEESRQDKTTFTFSKKSK